MKKVVAKEKATGKLKLLPEWVAKEVVGNGTYEFVKPKEKAKKDA